MITSSWKWPSWNVAIFSDSTHPFMTGSKCGRAYSLGSNQCSAIGIFTSLTQIVDRWSGVTVNTN
ncbi:hypothetical protein [Curtobacterium sp. MCBA15_008]|uniref:hypothetical protein n=1 Tax=Curtobacterium sp. MCBA15_008 TaxID=1898736 RepID=UPI0008DE59EB|nr:hypothetical protein [Curtobacterium sp. MCBA15_008]OII13407.1 hypothetical protein BIU96_14010 [Curtobacterium sp. MCBA15_008]